MKEYEDGSLKSRAQVVLHPARRESLNCSNLSDPYHGLSALPTPSAMSRSEPPRTQWRWIRTLVILVVGGFFALAGNWSARAIFGSRACTTANLLPKSPFVVMDQKTHKAFAAASCPPNDSIAWQPKQMEANLRWLTEKKRALEAHWARPQARRRQVALMAVSAKRMDILRANAYHFMRHGFDMILVHYDMQQEAYLREPWYTENLVVLAKEKRVIGKFSFFEDVYDNNYDLLMQYDYVMIPDADFLWTTVDLTCYVGNAHGFGVVGPAVVGRHRSVEQDPWLVFPRTSSHKCPIRTVNDIEVQAPMFPRRNLVKLKELLIPENHNAEGELESCWCLDFLWCNYMEGGCGVYETCGIPTHCDTKTLNKKSHNWRKRVERNCNTLKKKYPQFVRHKDNSTIPDRFRCYSSVSDAVNNAMQRNV